MRPNKELTCELCVHAHVCTYSICIQTHTRAQIYTNTYTHIFMHAHDRVMDSYTLKVAEKKVLFACMCVCIYVCVCICMLVCIYLYVCIYVYIYI